MPDTVRRTRKATKRSAIIQTKNLPLEPSKTVIAIKMLLSVSDKPEICENCGASGKIKPRTANETAKAMVEKKRALCRKLPYCS